MRANLYFCEKILDHRGHSIMSEENTTMVPEEVIMSKIFMIRGQKVMLDADLKS